MASLLDLLDQPLLQRLGWTLVHSVWQGAAAAMLLAMALLLLRRASASARYLAACVALLLMFSAMLVTFSILPQPEHRAAAVHEIQSTIFIKPLSAPTPINAAQIPPPTLLQRAQRAVPWLAAAWSLGVIVLSIRHLGGWLFLRKLRRANQPLSEDPWPQILARLVARLSIR